MVKKSHDFEGFEWYAQMATFESGIPQMATFKGFRLSQFWTIRAQNGEKRPCFRGFEWYAQMAIFNGGMPKW